MKDYFLVEFCEDMDFRTFCGCSNFQYVCVGWVFPTESLFHSLRLYGSQLIFYNLLRKRWFLYLFAATSKENLPLLFLKIYVGHQMI